MSEEDDIDDKVLGVMGKTLRTPSWIVEKCKLPVEVVAPALDRLVQRGVVQVSGNFGTKYRKK